MKSPHKPFTPAERETMRQARLNGKSLDEIAVEFSCSRITVRKICAKLLPQTYERGVPLSAEKIQLIADLRMAGRTKPDIARLLGISGSAVTKNTPAGLKISRPRKPVVIKLPMAEPNMKIRIMPKITDEVPDTVIRMTASFKARGLPIEKARAEAIRIYTNSKNKEMKQ